MSHDISFLEKLLDAAGPSGFEVRAARAWRAEAETFADDVQVDVTGNSFAVVNPGGSPRVMLAGHIDEIGLQITHIDDHGFIYIDEIGGWDPQVLVGQRVSIMGRGGDVTGVIGKKAIHLMTADDRIKASETKKLWVDVGAESNDEVAALGIRVGDPMVVLQSMVRLAGGRIASRAIDDRIGAFVVLEAIRMLSDDPPAACATAVATVQEEIGYTGGGARSSAYALEPDVAIAVDVTFSTDAPGVEKKELGDHKLGGGPVLSRGSAAHNEVFEMLAAVAEEEGIPYTVQASPKATRTDADGIFLTRSGVPTGLVSVPNRYMHSPNEVVSIEDLFHSAKLIAAFIRKLTPETDFTPR
ncbi:MAG: M42 family metallopeptidase [Gemmatimonadales bacterium]|jgi:endoglucanase|nr:M42 family metallopeptidase [Gemmatimonadales bacterium]MDG2239900.1 M42 family metallopeptidase [Longimicrobiales bacterium]NCG31523.1 M20/M25/M40 family metallo-hydrolase [Pseudomonadota bacterium]MBT3774025.1 M42 family metallopeptidase [Gemmatimonadales bacterium]MBT3959789.1 M42 family metallopeptidase [Gemmatimonadales bacterium]